MSLILEALRKSEAERQLGKLPGLMSPAPLSRRRRAVSPWWMALGVVLLLGIGGGWWMAQRLAPAVQPAAPAAQPAHAGSETAPTAKPAVAADEDTPASPQPTAPAPAAPLPPTPVAAAPASAPVAAAEPRPLPGAPAPPLRSAPASPPAAASLASTIPTSARLSEMLPAQRATLPPLKLSVHVFADEPSRRFAIIDGQRRVEGDELGGAVRLREIQREGVLLDIGGQPWLLERPR